MLKKIASVFGIFTVFIITLATLFKVQHYPGASVMLILGIISLATVFIPLFFIARMTEDKSALSIIANLLCIFSLSVLFLGLLFKIQHYPGGSIMTNIGAMSFIFPTSILLLVRAFQNKKSLNDFLKGVMLVAFGSMWILFFATSKFTGKTMDKILLIDEALTESVAYLENSTATEPQFDFLNDDENQLLKDLHQKRLEICTMTKEIDEGLTMNLGGKIPEIEHRGHWAVLGIRETDVTQRYLLFEKHASHIKKSLEEFEVLSIQCEAMCQNKGVELPHLPINYMLAYSHDTKKWEEHYFGYSPAFIAFPTLTAIKSGVLFSEKRIIDALKSL